MTQDKLANDGVLIQHHEGGRVYIKETLMSAGAELLQHAHDYEHQAYLAFGTVRLSNGKSSRVIEGPCQILIPAGEVHGVQALDTSLWLCIHAAECVDLALFNAETKIIKKE